MKQLLMIGSLIAGLLSAFFWVLSAFAKVPAEKLKDPKSGAYRNGSIIIDGNDLAATLSAQSRWNSLAAAAAALTAVLQVVANALPDNI